MLITLFPALNGDCILIQYASSHYILVDGGYVNTYKDYLLPKLQKISNEGNFLDLVVVTHIDSDHISGIIKLLEEEKIPIGIKQIWYNGYRHIQSEAKVSEGKETVAHHKILSETKNEEARPISAKEGCTLSALIGNKGIAWNSAFDGKPVIAPSTVELKEARIHLLSPSSQDITNLEKYWKKKLIMSGMLSQKHGNEFWDDAFEFNLSKEKPGFIFHTKEVSKSYDLEKIKEERYTPDSSATNGSSIAFVLEAEGKKVLMLGDAHAETITDSLNQLYEGSDIPHRFDAVKLSHHGSYNNNSPELLKRICSENWLISTNGYKFNHPDEPTLANVITSDPTTHKKLYFNYSLPICGELSKKELHNDYNFEIITPNGSNGVTVIL